MTSRFGRYIAWYALLFFLLLTGFCGWLLTRQNPAPSFNVPASQNSVNIDNLFGLK